MNQELVETKTKQKKDKILDVTLSYKVSETQVNIKANVAQCLLDIGIYSSLLANLIFKLYEEKIFQLCVPALY